MEFERKYLDRLSSEMKAAASIKRGSLSSRGSISGIDACFEKVKLLCVEEVLRVKETNEELAKYVNEKNYSDEQTIEKVRHDIGVDFLGYNDPENLAAAIGIPTNSLCFTCATGNYETLGIVPSSFKSRHEMKGE